MRGSIKRSVLLVSNFLSGSATPGIAEGLALHLRSSGWQVLTTSSQPWRPLRLLDMIATIWRKRRAYAIAQVDVFSTLAFFWAEAACLMLRLVRKPYVLTLHGGGLPELGRRSPNRVRRLLSSAVTVTVPSRYLLEQMAPYRANLRLLPNPLDLKAYNFRLRQRVEPRLIWVRSFHSVYNPSLAPRVLAVLRQELADARLTMIGPDKSDGSLPKTAQLIRDAGLADSVVLPGRCSKGEVPRWLERADVFLNTTDVDNTPISVLEAMACGLCVVSTNVGGLPYLLEHERDALLVPPNDPDAMAAAVVRLVKEPGLAQQISACARRKVEQFDWPVILAEWQRLLDSAVSTGREHETVHLAPIRPVEEIPRDRRSSPELGPL